MQLMESVVVDTVRYPAERDRSLKMSVSVAAHPRGHATGIAVCYSGLLRGFGGERSGALTNHEQYLLRPLAQLFPGELYVAFSMAHTHGQVEHLPARVMRTLATLISDTSAHVVQEARPLVNGSNYMAFLAFGGIEHCGRLIKAAASRRSRSFAFAVRMRYDFLIEPLVAGGLLAKWPIWKHAWQDPSLHLASPPDTAHSSLLPSPPSAILTVSKYSNANSTRTRGLQLWGCKPPGLPTRRCVPQDVFFVVGASAAFGPVENFFLESHAHVRWWLTEGLKSRQHAPERTMFQPALSRGMPLDIVWRRGGGCAWMLVDKHELGDARAPRAIFRNRCSSLRSNASFGMRATMM